MKKLLIIFLSIVLAVGLLSGCGSNGSSNNKPVKPVNSESQDNNKKDDAKGKAPGTSKVFKPNELLSEEEAASLVGKMITIQSDTLKVNSETGTSNTYYEYKLDESTDMNALFLLLQNGAIPKGSEDTAASKFNSEMKYCGNNAEPMNGLGDKAFIHKLEAQVNVLYGDYYILVAFGCEDKDKERELNIKIARKIIENIDKKK